MAQATLIDDGAVLGSANSLSTTGGWREQWRIPGTYRTKSPAQVPGRRDNSQHLCWGRNEMDPQEARPADVEFRVFGDLDSAHGHRE